MEAGGWSPNKEGVDQLSQLIVDYRGVGDQAHQASCSARLRQCAQHPEFLSYLAYLLAYSEARPQPPGIIFFNSQIKKRSARKIPVGPQGTQPETRQTAGLLLKNHVRRCWAGVAPQQQAFIKAALLSALPSPLRALRAVVGTVVSVVASAGGVQAWPELMARVVRSLDAGGPDELDGSLGALHKICEEVPAQLDNDMPTLAALVAAPPGMSSAAAAAMGGPVLRPADLLCPRLLGLFASPDAAARVRAVGCVNMLAGFMPRALFADMDRYVEVRPRPALRRRRRRRRQAEPSAA